MLSGFNTNFRHRGVLFHVQTEDSGLENPHVITHLFHGGNIMASEKRDYGDLIGSNEGEALENSIRQLMEGLHKSMLKQLSRGAHDEVITQRLGPDVFGADPVAAASQAVSAPARTAALLEPLRAETETETASPTDSTASLIQRTPEVDARSKRDESSPRSPLARVFGDRAAAEKPLDEVVLDYLVANARKRKSKAR